jgi:hypothetical protein
MTLRENAFETLDVAQAMAVAARDGLLRQAVRDAGFPHP